MKNVTFLLLFSLFLSTSLAAQERIEGGVKSKSGDLVVGATIIEQGTTNGTTTNDKGRFVINVKKLPTTIIVSFMGMETKEVRVANVGVLEVELLDMTSDIDEVVVIGYGEVRKSDLTGSVSSLKSKDITEARMLSFDQAMAGKMAGVNIIQSSGEPGAGLSIQIRGMGSINSDSDPLYVIDGAPIMREAGTGVGNVNGLNSSFMNPLSSLNPNDIQSIEILKDASATAIYGSRGANGVVLITTRSGREGKAKVNLSSYVGFSNVSKKIDVLGKEDYVNYMANIKEDATYINGYDDIMARKGHYWQNEMFKTGVQHNHSLSVSGGTKTTSYMMSAGYTKQNGIVDNSDYEKFNLRAKVDQQIGKRAKAGVNIMYAKFSQDGIPSGGSKDSGADVFQQMLSYRPANTRSNQSDLEEDGVLGEEASLQSNPLDYVNEASMLTSNARIQGNMYAQYQISKDLLFKTSFNTSETFTDKQTFFPPTIAAGAKTNGRGINANAKRRSWSWENILTYNKTFNKNHRINIMAGYTMESQYARDYAQETQQYPLAYTQLTGVNISHGTLILVPEVNENSSSLMSYLGRVNYGFKDRYLFTASIRSDGSSKFPKNKKISYFPSAAFAWKIDQEQFMKKADWISEMKLRLSYGQTGNQSIASYSSLSKYGSTYYSFKDGTTNKVVVAPGIAVNSMPNPDLTWETTEQYNAGVDMGFLDNKINVTFDAYYKKTTSLLLNKPLPYTSGYSRMMFNSGSLENKGLEISINTRNISTKNFNWTTSFNMSFNRNKILSLGENARLTFNPSNTFSEAFILAPGKAIGTMYGLKYDGVYQYSDYTNFYVDSDPSKGMMPKDQWGAIYGRLKAGTEAPRLVDGVPTFGGVVPMPGHAKFQNLTGDDNNVNDQDRTYIGNSTPKFYGGLTNKFMWRGFDFSIFLQFSYGNDFFVSNYSALSGYNNRNILKNIYDNSWRADRQSNIWPDMNIDSHKNLTSSMWVEDGSYLKIKDITLAYTFPAKMLSPIGISNLRIYVSGQNLHTFTNFSWYDPESVSGDPLMSGNYKFSYPSSRTIICGISLDF